MRHFFIKSLDILIGIFVILMLLGVFGMAGAAFGGLLPGLEGAPPIAGEGGVAAGIAVMTFGLIYVIFVAGFLYLGIGIYHNTKRTADAMDRMAEKMQSSGR